METKNYLNHSIVTTSKDGNDLYIKIKLDDECRNGHNDFSITGDVYKKGRKSDASHLVGGCIHDEILAVRPDLQIFVDLHLADVTGAPMYAVENGFYHLQRDKKVAQSYLRLTNSQFSQIEHAEDKDHFKYLIYSLGIVENWKIEADKAIALLSEMTACAFKDDSKKLPLTEPTQEFMDGMENKISSGYYSIQNIKARKILADKAKMQKAYDNIIQQRDKDILKEQIEANVKIAVLFSGLPLDSFLYYNHTNEGHFNWMRSSYKKEVSQDDFDAFLKIVDYSNLPEGIKFILK